MAGLSWCGSRSYTMAHETQPDCNVLVKATTSHWQWLSPTASDSESVSCWEEVCVLGGILHLKPAALHINTGKGSTVGSSFPWDHVTTDLGSVGILIGDVQNQIHGEHCVMYGIAESLCRIPETNTTLYADSTSIKKKNNNKRKSNGVHLEI